MPGSLSSSPQQRFLEKLMKLGTHVDPEKQSFMCENDGRLYFRVDSVKFEDLYDWSDPDQKWKSHRVSSRQLRRSNSMPTGSLVQLNEEGIALFRYRELLFAIKEKCPHLDLYDWSDPDQKWKSHRVSSRQLRRSNSMPTGSLVQLNEEGIALFRYRELLFAIKEKCPHLGGPLHMGDIEVLPDMSICVKCPWHKWCIDLTSGEVKSPKGRKEVSTVTFPTKIDESGSIFIGFENFSGKYFSGDGDF